MGIRKAEKQEENTRSRKIEAGEKKLTDASISERKHAEKTEILRSRRRKFMC